MAVRQVSAPLGSGQGSISGRLPTPQRQGMRGVIFSMMVSSRCFVPRSLLLPTSS